MANPGRKFRCAIAAGAILCFLGLSLIVIGGIGPPVVGELLEEGLLEQTLLTESEGFKGWQNNTFEGAPGHWKAFTFYNYSSIEDFLLHGSTPILGVQEVGPYAFRKYVVRFDRLEVEDHMYYQEYEYYKFDPENSAPGVSPDDIIISPNVPFIGVLTTLSHQFPSHLLDEILERIITEIGVRVDHESVFWTKSVHELLFGCEDHLMEQISKLVDIAHLPPVDPFFQGFNPNMTSLVDASEKSKYSIVNTGRYNHSKVGQFTQHQGQENVTEWAWPMPVGGTGGEQFGVNFKKTDVVHTYVPEIKRVVEMEYLRNAEYEGIPTIAITNSRKLYASAEEYPPNAQFFQFGPTGVANISAVQPGNPPLFISAPHFLLADPIYGSYFPQFPPDPEKYTTHLDVEPALGSVINAEKFSQLNIQMLPVPKYNPKLPPILCPIMWINENGHMTEAQVQHYKSVAMLAEGIVADSPYVGFTVGPVFFILGIVLLVWAVPKHRTIRKELEGTDLEDQVNLIGAAP